MLTIFFLGALLVTGCGGGGGGGGGSSGLTTSTAPTAKITTSSLTDANSLTKEIQSGTPDLVAAVSMQNIPAAISSLPGGISSLPAGTSIPVDCSTLSGGVSGTVTVDTNASGGTPTAGTYINMTFNSCVFTVSTTTFTLNGTSKMTYLSYTDYLNYSTSMAYSNFYMTIADSATSTNDSFGPVNGSYTLTNSGGTLTIATQLPNGGVTDLVSYNVYTSGTSVDIINATYVYNSSAAGGIIKVVFSNWTYDSSTGYPVSGTITVTDANGNTVVMTANGDTTVSVTYTIGGVIYPTYLVTFQ